MYTPPSFAETDRETLHEVIEQHSFATLVSQAADEPVASHLPLLLDRDHGPHGRLVGHMAKANPQWREAADKQVLAIFHGPHAYISPAWYEAANVVPTWNYVAVHAYGVLRLDDNRSRRLEIVRRYVDVYEAAREQPWSLDDAPSDFVDGLLDAIVGFTIDIDRLEGKRKLNQNHDKERQRRVVRALQQAGSDNNRQIARLMSDQLAEERGGDS